MAERLSIVHVSPLAWEEDHGVNALLRPLAERQRAAGHEVLVLAPSRSREAARATRQMLRAARSKPRDLFAVPGGVLAVGEAQPAGSRKPATAGGRGRSSSLAVDAARTLEELFQALPIDILHLHEPYAPSLGSVALRQSRALSIGAFHAATARPLTAAVARRFAESHFTRLDMRVCDFAATAEQLRQRIGGTYSVLSPGWSRLEAAAARDHGQAEGGGDAEGLEHATGAQEGGWRGAGDSAEPPVRILYLAGEERGAERLLLRALRHVRAERPWEACIVRPSEQSSALSLPLTFAPALQERVQVLKGAPGLAQRLRERADIFVCASDGARPTPHALLGALAEGAAGLASDLPVYAELLGDGERGVLFGIHDLQTLSAQLQRLIEDRALRARLAAAAGKLAGTQTWERAAQRSEALYAELLAHRRPLHPATRAKRSGGRSKQPARLIDVDLHMHTDHSTDCATPVEVLLATARERGLGAIAVTDHNELSGALAASEMAAEAGVKVIVGEEVKTAAQGEVIGLFLKERIERGMSMQETIAEIRRQGGLVYVPHPFDRLHSVPDYEHLLPIVDEIDAIEVFNPRVALDAYNEEARRFAAKYRIPAGAGSDAHVPQGLGSVRLRMRDFDGPRQFMESLREADVLTRPTSLLYVQALKFIQTKATPAPARRARSARQVRRLAPSEHEAGR